MKKITYLFLLAAALGACTPKPSNKVETIQPAAFVSIFPKGNAIEGTNFNGTAYIQRLMTDSGQPRPASQPESPIQKGYYSR